jgi:hypothetical protein
MPTTSRPPDYHLIYPLSKETRVCFYVSKAINQNEWETTEHSPDLVTLTIYLGGRTLHIHNRYNPHQSSSLAVTPLPCSYCPKRSATRENTCSSETAIYTTPYGVGHCYQCSTH